MELRGNARYFFAGPGVRCECDFNRGRNGRRGGREVIDNKDSVGRRAAWDGDRPLPTVLKDKNGLSKSAGGHQSRIREK